jgi:hypothetical protein
MQYLIYIIRFIIGAHSFYVKFEAVYKTVEKVQMSIHY